MINSRAVRRLKVLLLALMRPREELYGLEITEAAVHVLAMRNGAGVFTVSARIPPGTIVDGTVVSSAALNAALLEAHRRLSPQRKRVPVVLLLPPARIFTQSFALPWLEGRAFAEAVTLNLKALSPLPVGKVYASAEVVGGDPDGNRMELLGAFAPRETVDGFTAAVSAAGFSIAAVEFPARAVTRVVAVYGAAVPALTPLLVLRLFEGGLEMMIVRRGHLSFHELTSWRAFQEEFRVREVSLGDLTVFLAREVQRIQSFYAGRWGGALLDAVVIAPEFAAQVTSFLSATFGFTARPLALRSFGYLPPLWYPVLGAALRGRTPRAEDRELTLSSTSVHAQYRMGRAITFVALWRNAWLTLVGFFLLLAVALDGVAARAVAALESQRGVMRGTPLDLEGELLAARAAEFNRLLTLAATAQGTHVPLPHLFRTLARAQGAQISFRSITTEGEQVSMSGVADELEAIAPFKSALLREPRFRDVALPPQNTVIMESGAANFVATLTLTLEGGAAVGVLPPPGQTPP